MGYCHDMPAAYAAADLVICRAGASTVSELMTVKKPAILIPYPLATGGHQLANADVLGKIGAARVYEQKALAHGELAEILTDFLKDARLPETMASHYNRMDFDMRSAAKNVAELVYLLK
jgi:UDP-N-acetylglucosamine--N-acetylmuramyl-(pentapeptide) pyrophosphoryl-undecaprenol N-acetylglucosamine transferase